jgi:hypothetical protein
MPGAAGGRQRVAHAVAHAFERFAVLDWKKTLAEVYAPF